MQITREKPCVVRAWKRASVLGSDLPREAYATITGICTIPQPIPATLNVVRP